MRQHHTETPNRREALKRIAGAGSLGLAGLAGCVGLGGSGGSGGGSGNGSGGGGESATLKFAISGNQQSAHYTGADLLANAVDEKSDGRLQLDVICCQKAGGPPEITKSVQQGTLDMGLSAVNNLAGITSAWLFCQLPYLWQEHQSMYDFFNQSDVVSRINEEARKNLTNVLMKAYWGSNGGSMRHLHATSKAGFTVPSGSSEQKMRVTESPIEKATVDQWGFSPSPIAWSETVSAMKQGVVDGIHIHYWWLYDSGMFNQIEYTVETATQDSPAVVQINQGSYEGLSEDLQDILDRSIEEVTSRQIELDIEQGNKGKELIEEENSDIQIYQPTESEMKEWRQAAAPVYEQWLGEPGVEPDFVRKAAEFQSYDPPGRIS